MPTMGGRAQSNAPTPTADRLMAADPLHLKPLEGRRHVVSGRVVWGRFFCKINGHVLRQPIRKILNNRHVAAIVEVAEGLAALDGDAAVHVRAGNVCGKAQIQELIPQGKVRCIARGVGADGKDIVGPCPI